MWKWNKNQKQNNEIYNLSSIQKFSKGNFSFILKSLLALDTLCVKLDVTESTERLVLRLFNCLMRKKKLRSVQVVHVRVRGTSSLKFLRFIHQCTSLKGLFIRSDCSKYCNTYVASFYSRIRDKKHITKNFLLDYKCFYHNMMPSYQRNSYLLSLILSQFKRSHTFLSFVKETDVVQYVRANEYARRSRPKYISYLGSVKIGDEDFLDFVDSINARVFKFGARIL